MNRRRLAHSARSSADTIWRRGTGQRLALDRGQVGPTPIAVFDAASLLARSAHRHLRFAKPSATTTPPLYAGKVESTVLTLVLDMLGVSARDLAHRTLFFRVCHAFNLLWRTYDDVIDNVKYTTAPIGENELDTTPVWQKYMECPISGEEARRLFLDYAKKYFLGADDGSRVKMDQFEALISCYRARVVDTANNPKYRDGCVLMYPVALQAKRDLTSKLGTTFATLLSLLLDLPEDNGMIELCGGLSLALQFGDDYIDWRTDWREDKLKRANGESAVRPSENLLLATLRESGSETHACEMILTRNDKISSKFLNECAPDTQDLYRHRFQSHLDSLPHDERAEKAKRIISFTFHHIVPHAPDSGWFYDWARY